MYIDGCKCSTIVLPGRTTAFQDQMPRDFSNSVILEIKTL